MAGGCGREIMLLNVFEHRAVGGEVRSQPRHAFTHPFDPSCGNAFLVAGVKFWNHLAFESFVECLGFGRVPGWIIAMLFTVAQRPA